MAVADLRELIADPSAAELELIAQYGALAQDPRRERAFSAFAGIGLPHRRMEDWKWSDFRARLKVIEAPASDPASDPFAAIDAPALQFSPAGLKGGTNARAGLKLHVRDEAQAFGGAELMPLGAMTAALAGGRKGPAALLIEVTGPVQADLRLVFAAARAVVNISRVSVLVRSGGRLHILESHLGGAGLSAHLCDVTVQEGGSLSRTIFQTGRPDEAQIVTSDIRLDAGAQYTQVTLGFGAGIARLETHLTHQGENANAQIDAAYLAGNGHHVDITTRVRHGARGCTTRQLTKGAVDAGGRGVFQGRFHVPRWVGQKTAADMQHHALLLANGAEVNAKPELEIFADDVECAHGNTCGALDGDQLFYMRQRGLPETEARALLTQAFIAEALAAAPEAVGDILRDQARSFLASD